MLVGDSERWRRLGRQLRVDVVRATAAAGSGHPTSSMSPADLMAVLLAKHLRYDFDAPSDPCNDHLVFSKGHAAPLLYALYRAAGALSEEELLTLRRLGSRLEGHPTPILPWVDVATGSLGQGLPVGVGIALAAKRLDRLGSRVWVLCGDGEMAEGSMWEAVQYAAFMGLDNLVAVVDVNRLEQLGETMLGWDLGAHARRLEAFGWRTIRVDGHDVEAIDRAYALATQPDGRPTAIVARTVKGSGLAAVEDRPGLHGKPLPDPQLAIHELGGPRHEVVAVAKPPDGKPYRFPVGHAEPPRYAIGTLVPVRRGYGEALKALGGRRDDLVALDADVSSSTYTSFFAEAYPERYFEMHIAEQQMLATAVGLQVRGWTVFASTFAAFLCRAHDFLRMAAVSEADLKLVGSHAGVSIGEDGASQMALEDLAMLRAVHGSVVLYPSDANQAAKLVVAMAEHRGISYLRTTRTATPVIYPPDEQFQVGGSRVVRRSDDGDDVALVGAGITLHEALGAADLLAGEGIRARVLDCYSVKPIDQRALREAAREAGGRLVTVEDHRPQGGLGDAVLEVLAGDPEAPRVAKLAVSGMPGSGTPEQLRSRAGIDAEHVAAAACRLVRGG
jgi:transketolase